MQLPRSIGTALSLIVLLAACGGGPAATQAPAGATTNPGGGGGATTNSGGGGGGANFANGKAHFEVSGPVTKSGDLGFLPIASAFGGMDATVLNFTPENTEQTETLTITVTGGGQFAVVYSSLDVTVSGGACTTSNLNIGATTASGSFECTQTVAVTSAGATLQGAVLKGSFEARA